MDLQAAPNGVATIEDRILRITGYYGYYPDYSSQKSARDSVGTHHNARGHNTGELCPLVLLSVSQSAVT
uniref:Uncharacterized protein n=1 Tax=Sphaerodactylus townsendi TaxID=933632 RepID=A0ACB8G5P8_9SAUR